MRKIKIDLDYITPGVSFIYPLFTHRGEKILDERVALSSEMIAKIREKHGNIVYYSDATRKAAIPGYRMNIALNTSRETLDEIGKTERISRTTFRNVEKVVEDLLTDLSAPFLDVIDLLKDLKSRDEYLYNHSVNVGILAAAYGKLSGKFSEEELKNLTTAAYLHDIGQRRIDSSILNREGRLGEHEMRNMQRHPQLGYEMLKGLEKTNPVVLQGVLFHHERCDCEGYYELPYENLPPYPKIISICDTFDAMTSPRPYRKNPFTTGGALKAILNSSNVHFDYDLVESFISTLGPHLNGYEHFLREDEICELDTQELAIIRKPGQGNLLKPTITVFCRFVREDNKLSVRFYKSFPTVNLESDRTRKILKVLNNPAQLQYIRGKMNEMKIS